MRTVVSLILVLILASALILSACKKAPQVEEAPVDTTVAPAPAPAESTAVDTTVAAAPAPAPETPKK